MKKSKFVLIVFALALVINIQTFPLFLIFSINTSKISLHNNCIGEEPPITNPELNITEVIYNYKKHINNIFVFIQPYIRTNNSRNCLCNK